MLVRPSCRHDGDRHDDAGDVATWLGDLTSADPSVRRRAVRALRETPEAVSALCEHLAVETDAGVRSVLLTSLIRLKSEAVAGHLTGLLSSEDVALRSAVIEALQFMPDEALPSLRRLLDHPDSDVRIFAVNVITGFCQPWVRSLLAKVLAEEPHINVCLAAIDGLTEIGDESLVSPLTAFGARFPDVPLAQHAVTASIRWIREPR